MINMDNLENENLKNIASKLGPEKLQSIGDMLSKTIGISQTQMTDFLNDKDKISELTSKIRPNDMEKISILLDNPNLLRELLSSKKAAENIKKYID